jgi:hypothetical protein
VRKTNVVPVVGDEEESVEEIGGDVGGRNEEWCQR